MLIKNQKLITIDIFYYRPDYSNILQEFLWQTTDVAPELRRTHKFLNYWHSNINAIVQEVLISINERNYGKYRSVDAFLKVH